MYDDMPEEEGVLSWEDLLKVGEQESEEKLNAVLKNSCSK